MCVSSIVSSEVEVAVTDQQTLKVAACCYKNAALASSHGKHATADKLNVHSLSAYLGRQYLPRLFADKLHPIHVPIFTTIDSTAMEIHPSQAAMFMVSSQQWKSTVSKSDTLV